VRKRGSMVCYGFAGDNFGGLRQMIAGVLQMFFLNIWPDGKRVRLCATPGEAKKNNLWYRETLGELLKMLSDGTIRPVIGARVPLIEARRAHQLVEQGKVVGKVVLICKPSSSSPRTII
jgi:NADPH:quinone reductase-like Zn-dependent oxidoreductase